MRLRFHLPSAIGALGAFIALIALATVGSGLGWIRGYAGDSLAVIWVFLLLRSVVEARPTVLATLAFGTGCVLEFAQWVAACNGWKVANRAARIVLGSSPDWWDVVAYGVGATIVIVVSVLWRRREGAPARLHQA